MISEEKLREEFKSAFADLKKQEKENKEQLYRLYCELADLLDNIPADGLDRLGITSLCAIHSFKAVQKLLNSMYELIFEEEYVEKETDTDVE